ncbi:hypothetical protein CDD80_1650 [Ophiocordyceps camponoti-rufipedis]|uniref:Uncharacterized protein n=1 Tax=Ophiocordyceps camponoti-rufipedis TaxID=2004952 RepID=A0A2C5YE01_9HYPO|nr:hypothetical protein CDD80_1650 [Ophiocordyceps camponoti-rufipedis]
MASSPPPAINYILSFILVGLAWGLTTPFIRRAALRRQPRPALPSDASRGRRLAACCLSVVDFVRDPRYALPLLLNLSGSVWFFLLVGRAELSLTVPIVNTLAFLFTVLGEWLVEGKVVSKRQLLVLFPPLSSLFADP